MALTDEQLEQLEAYMDGELPSEQEGPLLHRLASEPELAAAMTRLRHEREGRSAVWRSCEPDEQTVQRVVMQVEHALDRHVVWSNRLARWRIPSAAAACILVGFLVGWVGRGNTPNDPGVAIGGAALVSDHSPRAIAPIPTPRNAPNPGLTTVGNRPSGHMPVDLPLVDEYGRQVGVQRFNSIEEAARFVEDLQRWQQTQQKVISGNVTLTGVQKF